MIMLTKISVSLLAGREIWKWDEANQEIHKLANEDKFGRYMETEESNADEKKHDDDDDF